MNREPADLTWLAAVHEQAEGADSPVGSGFLIDENRVLTCAHVVYRTLDNTDPHEQLWVAFPRNRALGDQRLRTSRIVLPQQPMPYRDRRSGRDFLLNDVAVLFLAEPLDAHCAAPLRHPEDNDLAGRTWWAFGFPDMLGDSAAGTVAKELGHDWLKLKVTEDTVEDGFSGTALWSQEYQAVVGMISHSTGQGGTADALSLRRIEQALPEEKLHLLSAGRHLEAAGTDALAHWGWQLTDDPETGRHWHPRARGVTTDADRGHRFRGRSSALTAVRDWLDGQGAGRRVLVVTGSPGAGKSALLARIITTADPQLADELPPGDDAVRALPGSVACAVHAKGKTARDVAREIARAASAELPERPEDLPSALRRALERDRRDHRFTVIVDALDEAATPAEARAIMRHIARPCAENLDALGVRIVVGTRISDNAGSLLNEFAPSLTIDLDDPAYFDRDDLVAYACATLRLEGSERPGNPYNDDTAARSAADQVARAAGRNFLVAGLIARAHGLYDTEPVGAFAPVFPGGRESMSGVDAAGRPFGAPGDTVRSVDSALDAYLERIPAQDGVPARTLLTALAYAESPGISADLWSAFIQALGDVALPPARIRDFARTDAANFLVQTSDDHGQACYRLFHQALNDALRRVSDVTDDQARLARDLIARGRAADTWRSAPGYLLRNLPTHAVHGNAMDLLLAEDHYPLYADLRALLPAALTAASSPEARERALLLRRTPLAIDESPGTRAALISLSEVTYGTGTLYQSDTSPAPPWRALWYRGEPRTEVAVLDGHTGSVNSISALPQADGSTLLATASSMVTGGGEGDGTVRIWDPATGALHHTIDGHIDFVASVCVLPQADGSSLLATGQGGLEGSFEDEGEGVVRIWDPGTGELRRTLAEGTGWARSVCALPQADGSTLVAVLAGISDTTMTSSVRIWDPATGEHHTLEGDSNEWGSMYGVPQANGGTLLAVGGPEGFVEIWDPVTGKLRRTLEGTGWAEALCVLPQTNGSTLLAVSGREGIVRIWDPVTGKLRRTLEGTGWAEALCVLPQADGSTLLAVVVNDVRATNTSTVRIWDPSSGELRHTLPGGTHAEIVVCVVPQADGSTFLATGIGRDEDIIDREGEGIVQIWDPVTGELRHTLEGHIGSVWSMCGVPQTDGSTLLATGGDDHTVRFWDTVTRRIHRPVEGQDSSAVVVCALPQADGTSLLAIGGSDKVRISDAVTGEIHRTLEVDFKYLGALCELPQTDGSTFLATGARDGTVRVWDPLTGKPRHTLRKSTCPVRVVLVLPQADGTTLLAISDERDNHWVWNPGTGRTRNLKQARWGNTACSVPQACGSTLLATRRDGGSIEVSEPVAGKFRHTLEGRFDYVGTLCALPQADGTTLLATNSDHRTIQIWDPVTGELRHTLEGHRERVTEMCAVPRADGTTLLATYGNRAVVRIWDLHEKECVMWIPVSMQVRSLCWIPNPGALAVGSEQGVLVIDVGTAVTGRKRPG
ncbi:AAA family ATPase [Streptomyces sp. NBC_01465]|uniref:AAA family ATPase n=1 Tax=Streptomyces sp. NBC_01465 TaxID=2903878 RepID=UPI002E365B28|nr:AAA family ATPase [Streptomyces sp. NBC_01465]